MMPSCTNCWMNMNFSSMCFALFDTPCLVAMDLPAVLSVCILMLIFRLLSAGSFWCRVLPEFLFRCHRTLLLLMIMPLLPEFLIQNGSLFQEIGWWILMCSFVFDDIQPNLNQHRCWDRLVSSRVLWVWWWVGCWTCMLLCLPGIWWHVWVSFDLWCWVAVLILLVLWCCKPCLAWCRLAIESYLTIVWMFDVGRCPRALRPRWLSLSLMILVLVLGCI